LYEWGFNFVRYKREIRREIRRERREVRGDRWVV
jgi:hypothetical protein